MSKNQTASANIIWNDSLHPHSTRFNDHYYSLVDGLEESHHVFITGNSLLQRWQKLEQNQCFCILETGFGSGLNFLATWQLWQQYGFGKTNKLHFISIEAFPLSIEELSRSLTNWEHKLPGYKEALIKYYPPLTEGRHDRRINQDNIQLTLLFGDIKQQLPLLTRTFESQVDAWFLDGFSPAKNPEMWSRDLFQLMASLSRKKASVATYTVAGVVRRGLAEAGFSVHKKPGFGTKRDMLVAYLE